MGVVFLVEDQSGHRYALKLLRPELADDAGLRARFRREVEAAQRVGGVYNARYLDADLDSSHPYLVTEYVDGGSLFDFVGTYGPLSGDRLIGLAVGLAEALVAMSAAGVIHRDLKPSNVLMAANGPKVITRRGSQRIPGWRTLAFLSSK
jgi:eukaryotic-like serine/threonine-protein kinase